MNALVAARLDAVARLLGHQHAHTARVASFHRAAGAVRGLRRSVQDVLSTDGVEGLASLPAIGESLARSIQLLVTTGRIPMLERLRGECDPEVLLLSIPGIGPKLADRLHHDLGIGSLEELEAAAHDGRLERLAGIGRKRLDGIREVLQSRLGDAPRPRFARDEPSVAELLDVDREYRERASDGSLRTICPRRFNPTGKAWLPILHAQRAERDYTALYSNTGRAHRLRMARDWVIVYESDEGGERQYTVVTAARGPLAGRRVVRCREAECRTHYQATVSEVRAGRDRAAVGT